jgi:hypothetical protein
MNRYLQLVMNVVNFDPGPHSERQTGVEDAAVMEECSPVTCEGTWLLNCFMLVFICAALGQIEVSNVLQGHVMFRK